MATKAGRLGSADLLADATAKPYTAPDGFKAAVTITLCNRNATTAAVSAAVSPSTGTQPATADWQIYQVDVPSRSSTQITAMVGPTQSVFVRSSADGVSATVNGIEEAL